MIVIKRFLATLFFAAAVLMLAACGEAQAAGVAARAETITVTHISGETEVPIEPRRVAVFDFGVLDTMYQLGLTDRIIGIAGTSLPNYLSHLDGLFPSFGTLHEPNLELLAAENPDLIIISGRARPMFDELNSLAPTIDLGLINDDFLGSFWANNIYIGRIFGVEEQVDISLGQINASIDQVYQYASGLDKNSLIILHNNGSLRAFGPGSRFGIIHDVLGVTPVDPNIEIATHGYIISNEYIVSMDPDIIFVVDRNAAVEEGEAANREDIENELVRLTTAYQNNNIFYLSSDLWYVSQGGIGGILMQIEEIRNAVSQAN